MTRSQLSPLALALLALALGGSRAPLAAQGVRPPASAATTITFDEALRIALRRNIGVLQATNAVSSSESAVQLQRADRTSAPRRAASSARAPSRSTRASPPA
jgi:hypothetical protein